MKKVERGFTLIELMVTVAIIGIIAAVGYPSYTRYIAGAHRKAAQAVMQTVQSKQGVHALTGESRGFATNLGDLKVGVPGDVAARYKITVSVDPGPPPSHSVQAVPIGSQAQADARCGTLTLRSTGEKEQSGTATDCWR